MFQWLTTDREVNGQLFSICMCVASAEVQPSVWCRVLHLLKDCTTTSLSTHCRNQQKSMSAWDLLTCMVPFSLYSQLGSCGPVAKGSVKASMLSLWNAPPLSLSRLWSIDIHCDYGNILRDNSAEGSRVLKYLRKKSASLLVWDKQEKTSALVQC